MSTKAIDKDFMGRKLHSLMGLGLVLFLFEHLLTNSESAGFLSEDGHGFIKMVNFIHSLPYLKVVEVLLIAIPIIFHALWGIKYLLSAEHNVVSPSQKGPALGFFRNYRYTFQRLTSWILLIGIVVHVAEMRFLEAPREVFLGTPKNSQYLVVLKLDPKLYSLGKRLNVELLGKKQVLERGTKLIKSQLELEQWEKQHGASIQTDEAGFNEKLENLSRSQEELALYAKWVKNLEKMSFDPETEVIAATKNVGTAFYLQVRDTFKDPVMRVIYSIFVLAAAFHAANGLWTALISWGVTLNPRSQRAASIGSLSLMALLIFLGFASIWGTYI